LHIQHSVRSSQRSIPDALLSCGCVRRLSRQQHVSGGRSGLLCGNLHRLHFQHSVRRQRSGSSALLRCWSMHSVLPEYRLLGNRIRLRYHHEHLRRVLDQHHLRCNRSDLQRCQDMRHLLRRCSMRGQVNISNCLPL